MVVRYSRKIVVLVLCALVLTGSFGMFDLRTTQAAAASGCSTENGLFYSASVLYGSTCLDSNGWNALTGDSARTVLYRFARCADGSIVAAGTRNLYVSDNNSFKQLTTLKGAVFSLACLSPDDVWVNYLSSVEHFDGKDWTKFDNQKDFGATSAKAAIGGIGIGPDKTVWVVTDRTLASYSGGSWKVLEEKSGLDKSFHLNSAPVFDSKGVLYVSTLNRNIVTFDGSKFGSISSDDLKSIQSLAVDANGNIYIGTNKDGLFVYDGKTWKNYTSVDGLSVNNIEEVAVDNQGRAWVATEWGLNVLVEGKLTSYTMANSGLVDNNGKGLLVIGDGPALPEAVSKKPSTVKGVIEVDGKPLANGKVQLCSLSAFLYQGDTPCGDMPDAKTVTTDAAGAFEFDDVAVGRYNLSFQVDAKGWVQATGVKAEATEGKVVDLKTLKFKSQ